MLTLRFFAMLTLLAFSANAAWAQKVYTTYLWHMDQPVYWADNSKDKPDSKQFVEESHRLKMSGQNRYPGSNVAHPTNDLHEIFSKADRVQAYQFTPRNAVNSIRTLPDAGAQLSISAGLLENLQSLGIKNQWGYSATWMNPYKEAIAWKTSGNFPRLDVVNFTYDHALSPLVSERTLKKQIKAYQYVAQKYYGYSTSKGYWPAEGAFSERIIKTLVECGIEWSVVANSHLARTLSDYVHPYNINGNIDAPNRADKVETAGINWFDGAIDGRGNRLAAPYAYQVHKARYIDPNNGTPYTIDIVPMCNYISYIDGYSGANVSDVESRIAAFSSTSRPSIVLLAHDGDNAWGGGSSYYNEAVPGFTHAAANAGYRPTTIQQFLKDHPTPHDAIVKVEDGAWVNADSDWGHPQFINWLWPLYSKPDYRFNPDGWTEDARNWAVITATENFVTMAEDLEGGNLRIDKIADGGTAASNAEKAWHFYFGGLNSGFMYYGKAEDMEVKPSMTGNIAIEYARKTIQANPNIDNTPPSVFIPQRYPYNPGSTGFGPTTAYKKVNYPSDFHVWTLVYDVSGVQTVNLKYRIDNDGWLPVASVHNKTYAGGADVGEWVSIPMTVRPMSPDPSNDPELNFFILPEAKADLAYAEIVGLKDKLIDYYVEATDAKGNITRSQIQHVYIGTGDGDSGNGGNAQVSWLPTQPTTANTITITATTATATSKLHWGVNGASGAWQTPNSAYRPAGTTTTAGAAVETPFSLEDGKWQVVLGPFNNPVQAVSKINFVINHGNNNWDNNGGSDYSITVNAIATENPTGHNISKTININSTYNFNLADFGYSSPNNTAFKAIRIVSVPTVGTLNYNGATVSAQQEINNPSLLSYTASTTNASFQYAIVDASDRVSDAFYTASFTVTNPNAPRIKVQFKRPTDWGTAGVFIWAWNAGANLFNTWPGVAMTDEGNGWFSYNFAETVSTINVIFSKSGGPQTIDITNITASSCYESSGMSGNKLNVTSSQNCNTTSTNNTKTQFSMRIYPQPARDKVMLELPHTGHRGTTTLEILSLDGRQLITKSFDTQATLVDTQTLMPGVYVMRIYDAQRKLLYSDKLMIR